jgi:hypothetical protein
MRILSKRLVPKASAAPINKFRKFRRNLNALPRPTQPSADTSANRSLEFCNLPRLQRPHQLTDSLLFSVVHDLGSGEQASLFSSGSVTTPQGLPVDAYDLRAIALLHLTPTGNPIPAAEGRIKKSEQSSFLAMTRILKKQEGKGFADPYPHR